MNDVTAIQPGTVVDGYTVEERIHQGGMGVIYRVSGPGEVPFPMVMKVPRLGPGEPAETVVTYEVEATVLAALHGPHVPRFVAAGDLATGPYLVMELIEGTSLKDHASAAPLPVAEVQRLGGALATAVHALHVQDAIHLDLKPSNVMLRPGGEAVLLDLGLAHHAHYPDLLAEEFRHPMGSAPYISPEQVLGVRSDPRSDLFSLGAILYQLATGHLPFGSPSSPSGLRKRLFRDPIPPRALVPEIPEWLQEVILRSLEPSADVRYASAGQLAFALHHPESVEITSRGRRLRRVAGLRQLLRWIRSAGFQPETRERPSARASAAPIVLAAVATHHSNEALFDALRTAARRQLSLDGEARLAVVAVIKPSPELGGSTVEEHATSRRIKNLVMLRHWAEPLHLPASRISFHAIEAHDPAGALLEYARANGVDHIVIGAPPPGLPLKGLLGTVATRVALEAPCTVTLVRPRAASSPPAQ